MEYFVITEVTEYLALYRGLLFHTEVMEYFVMTEVTEYLVIQRSWNTLS